MQVDVFAAQDAWRDGSFRAFISHVHEKAGFATRLRDALNRYAVTAFVAHADIEPAREWAQELERTLRESEAFILLLSEGVKVSDWVDQETGWALAQGTFIIPVALDLNPYGFAGRYQAIRGAEQPGELAETIFTLILREPRTSASIGEALVLQFERTDSFDDARWNFNLLQRVPAFTPQQLQRIEVAYRTNDQVRNAWYVQGRIGDFLAEHWRPYEDEPDATGD